MRELTRPLGLAAVAGLVAGIVASVIAHLAGHSLRPWLACAVTISAALVLVALYESSVRVLAVEPVGLARPDRAVLTDRKRGGLDVTVRMIERATSDPDRFEVLRTRLIALTTERLRATHGVDVRAEPQRARALVGDGLVDLLDGPPRRLPRRTELQDWLTRLENL